MATVLLVIDVQAGMFLEPDPVYNGPELLTKIGALIARARAAAVPVIYVQHNDVPGGPLESGSSGWQVHPAITPAPGETVVEKNHPDAFQGTALQEHLNRLEADHLVICGLQTDYCIDTTIRRSFSLGYRVTLVSDSHSTWTDGHLAPEQIISHHNTVLGGWFATLSEAEQVAF